MVISLNLSVCAELIYRAYILAGAMADLEDYTKELEDMANWQLHENYSYMSFSNGLVPRTRFMMVGFEWQKHDYSYCTDKDLSPFSVECIAQSSEKRMSESCSDIQSGPYWERRKQLTK